MAVEPREVIGHTLHRGLAHPSVGAANFRYEESATRERDVRCHQRIVDGAIAQGVIGLTSPE
ncbi:MAG: hypothetical protein ACYDAG_00500 [Chloroflexota bacterium]